MTFFDLNVDSQFIEMFKMYCSFNKIMFVEKKLNSLKEIWVKYMNR